MRIMDCVLLLFQKKLDVSQLDPDRPGPKPSWSESLKMMAQAGFVAGLQNFSKDTINGETVELMLPYFDMEDYNLETAKKVPLTFQMHRPAVVYTQLNPATAWINTYVYVHTYSTYFMYVRVCTCLYWSAGLHLAISAIVCGI